MSYDPGIGSGHCLAFGATNAREGFIELGDVYSPTIETTPHKSDDFFRWMADKILRAANENGATWTVVGFPGPVQLKDGRPFIGPMANIPGLSDRSFDLRRELVEADNAIGRLFTDDKYRLEALNDGDLAAQAAANLVEEKRNGHYDRVADLIIGTGIGAAMVERDTKKRGVFRPSGLPVEIGHLMTEGNTAKDTLEGRYSGPALSKHWSYMDLSKTDANHPVWKQVATSVVKGANILGCMLGAQALVPSGGVGGNRYANYQRYLEEQLLEYMHDGNGAQILYLPEIVPVPESEADIFELRGAEGHMKHVLTQEAA